MKGPLIPLVCPSCPEKWLGPENDKCWLCGAKSKPATEEVAA